MFNHFVLRECGPYWRNMLMTSVRNKSTFVFSKGRNINRKNISVTAKYLYKKQLISLYHIRYYKGKKNTNKRKQCSCENHVNHTSKKNFEYLLCVSNSDENVIMIITKHVKLVEFYYKGYL